METAVSSSHLANALAPFGSKPVYIKIGSYIASLTAFIDERTEAIILDIGEPEHERSMRPQLRVVYTKEAALSELASFLENLSQNSITSFLANFGGLRLDQFWSLVNNNECLLKQIAADFFDMPN